MQPSLHCGLVHIHCPSQLPGPGGALLATYFPASPFVALAFTGAARTPRRSSRQRNASSRGNAASMFGHAPGVYDILLKIGVPAGIPKRSSAAR
jgi:hypothetical protein